jgi:hypothetical protein
MKMGPEDNPADDVQPTKEEWDAKYPPDEAFRSPEDRRWEGQAVQAGKEPRKQSMLYEICPHCGGKGGTIQTACGAMDTYLRPCCKMLGVVETGATARQLAYMANLDTLRQEAGITAAMLRDGRARKMVEKYTAPQQGEEEQPHDALHASAPKGCKCSDCTMDKEPCQICYSAWWKKRHPNVQNIPEYDPYGDLINANRDEILKKHEEAVRRIRPLLDSDDHAAKRLAIRVLDALNQYHPMNDTWCGWPEGSGV